MLDKTRSIPEPDPRRGRKLPPGYERYDTVNWSSLTDAEIAIACQFADALVQARRAERELFLWWLTGNADGRQSDT